MGKTDTLIAKMSLRTMTLFRTSVFFHTRSLQGQAYRLNVKILLLLIFNLNVWPQGILHYLSITHVTTFS